MKIKTVNGMIGTTKFVAPTQVTIRYEKTGNFESVSLSDEKAGIMLLVSLDDIKKLVKG